MGFFLIGLLVVAGAVLASDAFTQQRDLQSMCDGAALAAANAIDSATARTHQLSDALPLAGVQQAAQGYLSRDPHQADVVVRATLSADGHTVSANCSRHTRLAFERFLGHGDGVEEHATANARSQLG